MLGFSDTERVAGISALLAIQIAQEKFRAVAKTKSAKCLLQI